MIREAKKEDTKQIIALIAASMPYDTAFAGRYYRQYFDDPAGDKVFVWEEDGQILGVVGYCLDIFSTKYSCELGWLTVDVAWRKKGIGRQLLKKVEKSAKAQKLHKLFVSAEDGNSDALGFYKQNGFRTEGVLRDFYGQGEDQIILSKWID